MPLFDFKCKQCDYSVETVQKLDDPAPLCPEHKEPMERQISIPARARFVGSGFYETDYKKKGK